MDENVKKMIQDYNFDESSRLRWLEYYRKLGFTKHQLKDMGLYKRGDKVDRLPRKHQETAAPSTPWVPNLPIPSMSQLKFLVEAN